MTALARITDKLRDHGSKVTTTGGRTMAQCPAHEDRTPSLAVTGIEGSVLMHCHAGCSADDVLDALELGKADLYDEPHPQRVQGIPAHATYNYDDGRRVVRSADKDFRQDGNTKGNAIYHLARVIAAVKAGQTVHLVEGEKDVHAIESLGGVATTAASGSNVHRADLSPLHGAHVVAVVDVDEAGDKWAAKVREALDGRTGSLTFVHAATGKDAADHIAAGRTLDEFAPIDVDNAADRARRLFPRLNWHELWADDTEEEWIHYPMLPARRLVSIYSAPKVGKSLLMLELAVALSRAETCLGYTPEKRWRVLYIDFENDPRGDVRSRLQAMGYGPDDLDYVDYLSFPTLAGLDSERGALELMEAIKAYGSEVIVIDTVSRSVDGEENSNDTWLGFYRHTGLRLKQAGVAMIRLDHSGKDESKGQRGGSAKVGDVDAVWKLTRVTDERFRMECTDVRFQLDTKTLHITRHRLPRLHHAVDSLMAPTDREAKVRHLLALANEVRLPGDAGREKVRELAKSRGISARNDVLAEVVKARKATAKPVPNLGDNHDSDPLSPPAGTNRDNNAISAGQTLSPLSGTTGDNPTRPHLSPGQQSLTAPAGTAGQTEPMNDGTCNTCHRYIATGNVIQGHTLCADCTNEQKEAS